MEKQFRGEMWHGDGRGYTLYCSQPAGALDLWGCHFSETSHYPCPDENHCKSFQTDIIIIGIIIVV